MKKLFLFILFLTLGVKSLGFPYKVNTANVNASEVTTSWTNFIWSINAGSDQSFVFHTDQQGVTKVALRFGITAGSTNYPLEWQSTDISLTPTGSIFQGYLSRTSLPPDRTYYAEFAGFIGTNITDAGMSIGRGRINIQSSLFTDANYTTQIVYQSVSGRTNEVDPVYLTDKPSLTNLIEQAPSKWSSRPAAQSVDFAQQYATNIGGIDFDSTPSGPVGEYRMQWNSDRSTLDLGLSADINLDVGQQLFLFAKSIETNTINKGEVVLVVGASGDNPTIKRASNASEALSSRTIGIAAQNISSNNNGFVVTAGTVYNINTSGFSQGAPLYLGANGTLQTNLPVAPLHGVFIGTVERVGENNGQIFIQVQNYQEIEELSDVNVRNRQVNDLLMWNGTVWTNALELDPVWVAASSLYYTAAQADALFATGTPLYGVDLSAYATGTPLYSYTETDPVWTSASSLYYTIVSADAKFATGTPIYSISGKLDSNVWASADSTTNYALRTIFATATNSLQTNVNARLFSNVWAIADSTTNYQSRVQFVSASNSLSTRIVAVSNAVRGTQYGSFTNDITLDEGGVNLLGKWSKSLKFSGVDQSATKRTSGIRYFPYGGIDYLYWDGAFNSEVLLLSNNTINAGVMTPVLDGYYERVGVALTNNQANVTLQGTFSGDGSGLSGVSASATNAVSTISLTSAVQDAVTFVGSGISQTGSTFNWNGYLTSYTETDPVWSAASNLYATTAGVAAAYLSLAGGTMSGSISTDAEVGNSEWKLDFSAGEIRGSETWLFTQQPTIPGYLTSTGAAATYVQITNLPAQIVTTNNLSNIAGSGLAVSNNQLVVTNVAGGASTFEELTGNNFVLGNGTLSNISATATGAFVAARISGTSTIGDYSYGSSQQGNLGGTSTIEAGSYGSVQRGYFSGSATIKESNGAEQIGEFSWTSIISNRSHGAVQRGIFASYSVIGTNAFGAQQIGALALPGSAVNLGAAAIQLIGNDAGHYLTTANGRGSILLGPGTNDVAYSVKAAGGFYGNAAGLTNFPSSLLTVSAGNTNYLRRTTVPPSNTAFGAYNQFALDNTNLYIYNATSSKWLRISGTLEW